MYDGVKNVCLWLLLLLVGWSVFVVDSFIMMKKIMDDHDVDDDNDNDDNGHKHVRENML